MTKDGRPSLINNIRLFGDDGGYLEGQEEAVAYGRRIAFLLNSEGFSLGASPELYVLFTPSLEPGSVEVKDERGEWWHRYVHVGVPAHFPHGPDMSSVIANGIVDALLVVRPDDEGLIRRADEVVREQAAGLRFLLKRREMAKLVVELSFNIGARPEPSNLFIAHIDKETGAYCEADPIALGTYLEGFALASGIRLQDALGLKKVDPRPMVSKLVKPRG